MNELNSMTGWMGQKEKKGVIQKVVANQGFIA